MSGNDSDPVISPSLTDAEISRFIALIDVDRLRSYNFTEDERSRIVALFDPILSNPTILTVFMIFIPSMYLFFAGGTLDVIYQVESQRIGNFCIHRCSEEAAATFKRCIHLSRYSRTPDLKGLKDIGESYFAETYTDNFK